MLLRAQYNNLFSLQQKPAIRSALHVIVLRLDQVQITNSDLKPKIIRQVQLISELVSLAPQPPPEQTHRRLFHNRTCIVHCGKSPFAHLTFVCLQRTLDERCALAYIHLYDKSLRWRNDIGSRGIGNP